jgi:hypothetical protein
LKPRLATVSESATYPTREKPDEYLKIVKEFVEELVELLTTFILSLT